jgi:hypothetical protein
VHAERGLAGARRRRDHFPSPLMVCAFFQAAIPFTMKRCSPGRT